MLEIPRRQPKEHTDLSGVHVSTFVQAHSFTLDTRLSLGDYVLNPDT